LVGLAIGLSFVVALGMYGGPVVARLRLRRRTRRGRGPSRLRVDVMIRPYVPATVVIEVVDSADPHPAWVVSSRHPSAMVAAMEAAVGRLDSSGG
jgi:hypothetical protein